MSKKHGTMKKIAISSEATRRAKPTIPRGEDFKVYDPQPGNQGELS